MGNNYSFEQQEIAREYWDFIQDVLSVMPFNEGGVFVYGLDKRRSELHAQMCDAWDLEEQETKEITDHLDRYKDFDAFLEAMSEFKKSKSEVKHG